LQLKSGWQVSELSKEYNPVLTGWKNYFCRFNASAMSPVWHHVNLLSHAMADAKTPKAYWAQ
jgi:RNA-directed DNA polymerase